MTGKNAPPLTTSYEWSGSLLQQCSYKAKTMGSQFAMYHFRAVVAMPAPAPLDQYGYKPLMLETLAMGVTMEHHLDTSVLPDPIKADLEKQRQLAGRYRITRADRKVERKDGQEMTEEQWDVAMDGCAEYDIGAGWIGDYITLTKTADGRSWVIRDPDSQQNVPVLVGLGQLGHSGPSKGNVMDHFYEKGALKIHTFRMDVDERALEAAMWCEFELTRANELAYTRKDHYYDEELDLELISTETFLARRRDSGK
jgi:hypothetical protein